MSNINLKSVMKAIDVRDVSWYNNLSEDEKSEVNIWQLMRFASSTNSSVNNINHHYLCMINEIVNKDFNVLRKHPELQFRLLQTVGVGTPQFHPWIKPPKSEKKNKLIEFLKDHFRELNDDEINILALKDKSYIKSYLLETGLTEKEVKEILK